MELQQLRYVLAVAETRNFTRAAERCFVVQSALSHQIAGLERELDVRLFERTSRRVELTAAGAAFLPAARACLDAAARAVADAAAATGRVRGRLRLGIIPTAASLDVVAVIERYRARHPEVSVALRVGSSDDHVADVRSGALDVGLLGLPEGEAPAGVAQRQLGRDRHVALVSTGHELAGRRRVTLEQLAREPFADFPRGGQGRSQTDRAFAAAGLTREVPFEVLDPALILDLVRRGLAVALLPSRGVADVAGVAALAVAGGPTRTEHLVWSAFNPSPAATAFLELVD